MEYHYPEMCLPQEHILVNDYASEYLQPYVLDNGDYQQLGTVLSDGGDRFGVSTVVFDKSEELIWMGNQGGHVTSYYGPAMQKYTSFQVHENEEVRHIATVDQGILALTKSSLRYQLRRGIPKHTHRSVNMIDMQCLLQVSPNKILMGGHQDKFIELDLIKMTETVSDINPNDCVVLSSSGGSLLAAGSSSGLVSLKDPRCPSSAVHEFVAHVACLSDLAIQGDTLITCGFTYGIDGAIAEEEVLVWDTRSLREGRGMNGTHNLGDGIGGAPLLLHFLPAVSGKAAVMTAAGYVFILDLNASPPDDHTFAFQVDTQSSLCSSFDVSSTSQAFVFADHSGHIHLFSPQHNSEPFFNNFSRETEFADPVENLPFANFLDENFPLSSVPLPPLTTGSKWLSDWPDEFLKSVYRRPKPIDPEVLATMKMQGPIGYSPNPRSTLRNQMPYLEENFSEVTRPNVVTADYDDVFTPIPKRYHKVEIRYAKHSNSDTEFDHYNKTGFPGLEATLPNSYCNSMLQVLYYTQALKMALLQHTCAKEFCLCCELGFLFRMLDTSSGAPCQASNFLRAFRTVPEAAALGLILPDTVQSAVAEVPDLTALVQSWSRFILHQLHSELVESKRKNMNDHQIYLDEYPIAEDFSKSVSLSANVNKKDTRHDAEAWDRVLMMQDEDYNRYLWVIPADQQKSEMHETTFYYDGKKEGGGDSNLMKLGTENATNSMANSQINDLNKHSNREETEISELFGIKQFQINRCLKCNREDQRECVLLACALQYPTPNTSTTSLNSPSKEVVTIESEGDQDTGFGGLVRGALAARRTTPAWCESCRRFRLTAQRASLQGLPPVLVINCGGLTPTEKAYWSAHSPHKEANTMENGKDRSPTSPGVQHSKPCRYGTNCARPGCHFKHPDKQNKSPEINHSPEESKQFIKPPANGKRCWIPYKLNIKILEDRDVAVEAIWDEKSSTQNDGCEKRKYDFIHNQELLPSDIIEYNLYAVVCSIEDSPKNVVSFVKMETSDISDGKPQWYLFNDVSITPVSASEAVCYVPTWKRPCVLLYACATSGGMGALRSDSRRNLNTMPTPTPLAPTLAPAPGALWAPPPRTSAATARRRTSSVTFTPLAPHEMPTPGMLVGMDAEFVTLNPEEVELRSNGQFSTVRPSHMSVARITCVRGQGPLEGTPFIDDYISTQEQVVDYMTKFSGIKPGDLDANFSSKHLTTLKSTYQKLRYLVDSGVVFVGHGLKNDFRVINLVVPPEQIIDTVQLFHLPHHRMVSLKFLAWHFLGGRIQTETHDSAEDACTALRLRKVWAELGSSGELRHALTALYHAGETSGWAVPPP